MLDKKEAVSFLVKKAGKKSVSNNIYSDHLYVNGLHFVTDQLIIVD